ncbi:MAG: GDYXXLXY domain-containing protein [Acinetobacter sp.]|nr:GDYXXLXY domain-containing protein [Acinetobacter sp.]
MKRLFPLILAGFSILIFVGLILKHENHLANSQSIFVELAPIDPRSILQGDYMILNYELYFDTNIDDGTEASSEAVNDLQNWKILALDKHIQNHAHPLSYVLLDEQRRVIQTRFDDNFIKADSQTSLRLVLKNPSNQLQNLYPAANSFMFAEGLEPCYNKAKYAEIKVKENGLALLVDLVDQNLKSLNCENSKNLGQGS